MNGLRKSQRESKAAYLELREFKGVQEWFNVVQVGLRGPREFKGDLKGLIGVLEDQLVPMGSKRNQEGC